MFNKTKKIFTYTIISVFLSSSIVSRVDGLNVRIVKIPFRNAYSTTIVDFSKLFEASLSEMLKSYKINIQKPVENSTPEVVNAAPDPGPDKTTQLEPKKHTPAPESEKPTPTPKLSPESEKPAPTPTPEQLQKPAPTPAPTTSGFSGYQQEVLNIVNKERISRGLSALKFSGEVSKAATAKSQDMINRSYFDHNSPTYGSPFDMMKQFGISFRSAGENIAMGQRTPQEVMTGWMNSDGHRKNILNSGFTEIGIGIAKDSNGRIYWTQMFIGR